MHTSPVLTLYISKDWSSKDIWDDPSYHQLILTIFRTHHYTLCGHNMIIPNFFHHLIHSIDTKHQEVFSLIIIDTKHLEVFPLSIIDTKHQEVFPFSSLDLKHQEVLPLSIIDTKHQEVFPLSIIDTKHQEVFPFSSIDMKHQDISPSSIDKVHKIPL
jgi:hypothetical protein